MTICALMMLLAASCAGLPDSSDTLVPPSWTLPAAHIRTRGAHEHDWIQGPRGGMYYLTPRGTKVYRRRD